MSDLTFYRGINYTRTAMAAKIPASLKAADLSKFTFRAGQLELAKPVVAYWCKLISASGNDITDEIQVNTG
jgi:hypothetical protein